MTAKDYKLISSSALFAGLSQQECGRVLDFMKAAEGSYKAGDILHLPGTELRRFGFVLSGLVQVYRDEPDGTRMLMASNGPGDSFGESLCFLKVPNAPVTIAAAEDSRVLWLSLDGIRECGSGFAAGSESCRSIHDITMRMMSCFAARALSMNDRIQVLSQRSLRKKILTLLTQYSRRAAGGTFSLPFSREDMAVYLGCDRSALSRELAAMKKDGIIDYYKNSFRVIK